MDSMKEAAIVTAISIENRSMGFYRVVSSRIADINTRRVFELLAKEEEEHLQSFCNLYQGNEDELAMILSRNDVHADPYYCALIDSIDSETTEKDALLIAIKEELACIELYTVFTNTIRAPHVREVFLKTLDETRKHSEMIADEYMRVMNMVHCSDQDIYVRE